MPKSYPINQHWLHERFDHVNTILEHIRLAVHELRDNQALCANRCKTEMNEMYHRMRDLEQKQALANGASAHRKESQQIQNLGWQMLIALGTVGSAIGAFVGYLIGKVE